MAFYTLAASRTITFEVFFPQSCCLLCLKMYSLDFLNQSPWFPMATFPHNLAKSISQKSLPVLKKCCSEQISIYLAQINQAGGKKSTTDFLFFSSSYLEIKSAKTFTPYPERPFLVLVKKITADKTRKRFYQTGNSAPPGHVRHCTSLM